MRGIRRSITTAAFVALALPPVVDAASWARMPSSHAAVAIDQPSAPAGRSPEAGILALAGSGLMGLAFVLSARAKP